MKNKIHYIITALLTITCVYLAWQLHGVKKYLEVQTEMLNKQSELNDVQGKLNTAQESLNNEVFKHVERLYERR